MTSNEEEETSGEMLVLGAEDCLRKPLTDGVLRMRINKVRDTGVREWECRVPGLPAAACVAGCACRRTSVTGGGIATAKPAFAVCTPGHWCLPIAVSIRVVDQTLPSLQRWRVP